MQREIQEGLRSETDEAQWGVNAFVVVSCVFSLLLSRIFAAVLNKMYQWTETEQLQPYRTPTLQLKSRSQSVKSLDIWTSKQH